LARSHRVTTQAEGIVMVELRRVPPSG